MHLLFDGPSDAFATVLLAHGAGAPMDSTAMTASTKALVGEGFRVAGFEFAYMTARRNGGRRLPPKAELLQKKFRDAVDRVACVGRLIIGGKSMVGRVASMVADRLKASGKAAGLICLGYPFHPPTKPHLLRTEHLKKIQTETLICQGTRDPFGTRCEVDTYDLSDRIEILQLEDGDHDLNPRKKVSGFSAADHMKSVAQVARQWAQRTMAA